MFSYFAGEVAKRGKRCLVLAHRDELLDQISMTLNKFSVPHSFIAAGRYYLPAEKVQVASVFSVVRRLNAIQIPDFIIIDEAHHCTMKSSWGKVLQAFPGAWKVGVTATPQRLSGEALGDVFDDLIVGPSVSDLVERGALSPYRIYAPSTVNTAGVHMLGGDFNNKELSALVDKPSITGDVISHYKKIADGKRTVVACVSIEHAKHVAEQFRAAGYEARCLDGTLAPEVRREMVECFRSGAITVLTFVSILSEGFDLPAIEVAIMLRPTASLALWIQQSGRALRPFAGKDHAIILDHAGNSLRHGLPDEEREWSLAGRAKRRRVSDEDNVKVRVCPSCFAVQLIGASACGFCGHMFEIKSRKVDQRDGELVEVDKAEFKKQQRIEQGRCGTFQELVALGRARKMKNPYMWAKFVWQARMAKFAA